MNDCRNAEIRDQLPDLLHDRLTAGAREAVLAHVGQCAECRDELELIRVIHRAVMSGTPRVDVTRIVSTLPKPGASIVAPMRRSRSRWADWRIAAAITLIAIGGTSVALLDRAGSSVRPDSAFLVPAPPGTQAPAAPSTKAAPSKNVTTPPVSVAETNDSAALDAAGTGDPSSDSAMEGRLRGLSEQQLKRLLDDIGQLKATPVTEPEPINIKVDVNGTRGSAGETEMK